MELVRKRFLHSVVFIISGLVYYAVIVDYYSFGILSLLYFMIIYAMVESVYYYVSKKTKFLTKKKNRVILIISTVIASIMLLFFIFATIDYYRVINEKSPIFTAKSVGYSKDEFFPEDDINSYIGLRYTATEYYGFGYKLVVCDSCEKSVYFMPLWIGNYTWSTGIPFDKLNGRWFHANDNDIYLIFDGVGGYSLSVENQTAEEGTYILDGDAVVLTPKNNNVAGNCTIENNYYELHCDKYAEVFMK